MCLVSGLLPQDALPPCGLDWYCIFPSADAHFYGSVLENLLVVFLDKYQEHGETVCVLFL